MKIIYVAGKYRDKSEWNVIQNIRKAEALAIKVWKAGMVAICPHKNTSGFGGICPDQTWLDGDFEIIKRCDAVLLVDNWKDSKGARDEVTVALGHRIPVFQNFRQLVDWNEGLEQAELWEEL